MLLQSSQKKPSLPFASLHRPCSPAATFTHCIRSIAAAFINPRWKKNAFVLKLRILCVFLQCNGGPITSSHSPSRSPPRHVEGGDYVSAFPFLCLRHLGWGCVIWEDHRRPVGGPRTRPLSVGGPPPKWEDHTHTRPLSVGRQSDLKLLIVAFLSLISSY